MESFLKIFFSVALVATAALIILRLASVISWPWWVVTAPAWASLALLLLIAGAMALFLFIIAQIAKK